MNYIYSIANDTLNGRVSTDILSDEIYSSDITIALDYINTSGDILDIYFKDILSSNDKSLLDEIVSQHAGLSNILDNLDYTRVNDCFFTFFYNDYEKTGDIVVNDTTEVLFKTYDINNISNIENSYLTELTIGLDDKDSIINIYIDDTKIAFWNVDISYRKYLSNRSSLDDRLVVWSKSGIFYSRLRFNNTLIKNNLKIKIKRNRHGSEKQEIELVNIIYNREEL